MALRELEGLITEQERQTDNQQTNETLHEIRETIAAHQARLDEHQQRLDTQEQFLEQLAQLTQELSRQSQQIRSLTSTVVDMTSWRHAVDQSLTTLDEKIEAVSLQLIWKKFWNRIGYRLYGPLLQDRWHYVTEVGVGILIIAIVVGYFQLLPPTYQDEETWQFGMVVVVLIIVVWEIGRIRLGR
jgi:DNA repair exonuclease SbcCD ATPase subunit